MTGQTTKYSVPYSAPGDTLSSIDDTMKLMAERLDLLRGENGSVPVTLAANTNLTQRVNYTRSYASLSPLVPLAMATMNSANTNGVVFWTTGHDATGFTIGARCATAGTYSINWSARA